MKFMLLLITLSSYAVLSKCSLSEILVHPGGIGGLYKGPNSETIIKGPDGSVITAQDEGGSVATQDLSQPIVVADIEEEPRLEPEAIQLDAAPVAAPIPPVATVSAGPVPVEVIQPDPHIIETEIVDAPVVEPQEATDLVGPSGSISTRGSSSIVSGPASTTISEPARVLIAAAPANSIPVETSGISLNPTVNINDASPEILLLPAASSVDSTGVSSTTSTLSPTIGLPSTTLTPPSVWEPNNVVNPAPNLILDHQQANFIPSTVQASVEPASSYGVISNDGNFEISTLKPEIVLSSTLSPNAVTSTSRPEIVLASTLSPSADSSTSSPEIVLATLNPPIVSSTISDSLDLRQLNINPSLIPSANIIPPEIGIIPPRAIDLGSTVTVSSTGGPGLVSQPESGNIQKISPIESVNIQRIHSGNEGDRLGRVTSLPVGVEGGIDPVVTNQVTAQNQIVLSQSSGEPGNVVPVGYPGNIPWSESRVPQTLDQEIDEVSQQLWSRYSRDVEVDKKQIKEE